MFSQGVFGASENLRIGKWKFFVVMIKMFIYVGMEKSTIMVINSGLRKSHVSKTQTTLGSPV